MPSWASLAHALHDSTRDAGSNVVSMVRDAGSNLVSTTNNFFAGARDLINTAMTHIGTSTVVGLQVLPAVAPSVATITTALAGVATVAIGAPGAVAALAATGATVRAGGVGPLLRSFFGF
jgi:predicted phage tail protein